MGHPQFLKQGKRFPQQLLSMHDASLTVLCELNCGSCEEGACEFRAQAFALSDLLGSAQVHPCGLPIVTLSGEQSQDAINEKPVVLAAKCQQTGIEEDSSFLISQGKRCQSETDQERCRRQDSLWQPIQVGLHACHGGPCLLPLAYRRLHEAKQTGIEHEHPQAHVPILLCHGQGGLQLALGEWVRFLLVGQKAVDLVEESSKHRAGQVVDNGMGSLDHLLCIAPSALRSVEQGQPGVGGAQVVRLPTALNEREALSACFMRTPQVSHPVGGYRQVQTALCGLRQIAMRLGVLKDLLEKLYGCNKILSMQGEVLGHDAPRSLLQSRVSQKLRHLYCLLGTGHPFLLLPHINGEQKGEIRQDVHRFCTRTIPQQRQSLFERCPRCCSFIQLPVGSSQSVNGLRKCFPVTLLQQPVLCDGIGALGLLLLACQQSCFAQPEQHITTSPVLFTQQVQGHPIMGDRLFSCCRLQCLCCSTERVIDASRLVATACTVEGQRGELVHIHGLLLPILGLKEATNEPMQASTPRGADFRVEALTNFVMGEREGSRLLGSNEPRLCSLKQARLNSFHLLLLHRGKQ